MYNRINDTKYFICLEDHSGHVAAQHMFLSLSE